MNNILGTLTFCLSVHAVTNNRYRNSTSITPLSAITASIFFIISMIILGIKFYKKNKKKESNDKLDAIVVDAGTLP